MKSPIAPLRQRLQSLADQLSPRQRQWATLLLLLAAGVGMLWAVFASGEATKPATGPRRAAGEPPAVTHIGVMSPGQQVKAVDQWVGTAGTRLAQYESERESQARLNTERQAFETRTMQRFAELEQRLLGAPGSTASQPQTASPATPPAVGPARAAPPRAAAPANTPNTPVPPFPSPMPPPSALPVSPLAATSPLGGTSPALRMPPGVPMQAPRWAGTAAMVPGTTPDAATATPLPLLNRVRLAGPGGEASAGLSAAPGHGGAPATRTISTFLPVSFTRGTLLGGLDAPTGGQAQSNPHPVLIRLADNAVLPNRFRGDYRECFVIAAGYGDISSERAYLRTENLSCVRADGAVLEVRLQGSVYGEDGKVGMRGRLVTKQGQMLANALLAGVVSGIGQGLATSSTQISTSPLGTITSAAGAEAFRAGIGNGVGRALDRLAQYYIKLAENTFPVIEVDAGREIDVVITRGVRIDTPMTAEGAAPAAAATPPTGLARAVSTDHGGSDEQD
jgi:conjugal transfer pilus assembly protein TraB